MDRCPPSSRPCPYCGTPLPAEASFCPHCAQSVGERVEMRPPVPIRWRQLRLGLALAVLALLAAGLCSALGPRVYDAQGQVYYSDAGSTYQVVLARPDSHLSPACEVHLTAEIGEAYRFPVRLYVNHTESDASANERFLERVTSVTADFLPPRGGGTVSCLEPAPAPDYSPDAALVSYVDFTAQGDFTAQMVWTIRMQNGDLIRLRLDLVVSTIRTYDFTQQDAPMATAEDLQALVDSLADTVEPSAVVNVHLPAVTYDGPLVLRSRPINFYGSTDGDRRTTFTAPVRLEAGATRQNSSISYFQDIDFAGGGAGVAFSAAADARLTGCTFSGWKTGVLGYGSAWVNVIGCTFTDNAVGFHFNSRGSSANHSLYNDNLFQGNGAAVMLESVPTDVELHFTGSVFIGNDIDIDNRCSHPTDISEAVFQ